MKKLFFGAIALFTIAGAVAQDNVIKANPLALLGGTDLIAYERKISDHSSVLLGAGYGSFKFGGAEYTSSGVEGQYRYYFGESLKGWYAGGQVAYTSGKIKLGADQFFGSPDSTSGDVKFGAFGVGAKGGYQWIFGSGFVIDLNLGAAYTKFDFKGSSDSEVSTLKGSGILPTFGFGLGYNF